MFSKNYDIAPQHVDFQGVVDGLYYPFYFEWARHAFMAEVLGLDIEEEFKLGRVHMLLEYSLKFKKSLKASDKVVVTCRPVKSEKRNRVNFEQKILVDNVIYAEAVFIATCLVSGRPSIPESLAILLE
ncbi:acyl-CoA thioesterase [Serratia marcescens]|uniref:acyl-CoA thioesterase n=1 Tax=Serratia marcescens TaxID=615 RepID=UPI000D72AA7F|nr:acyl-CoA thioesterase [Serratia marcescens]AWO77457.1 thioesterase [Serratia marcescens]